MFLQYMHRDYFCGTCISEINPPISHPPNDVCRPAVSAQATSIPGRIAVRMVSAPGTPLRSLRPAVAV